MWGMPRVNHAASRQSHKLGAEAWDEVFVSANGAYMTAGLKPCAGGAVHTAGRRWLCKIKLARYGRGSGAALLPYAAISAAEAVEARAALLPLRPSHSRPEARATNPLMGRLQGWVGGVGDEARVRTA